MEENFKLEAKFRRKPSSNFNKNLCLPETSTKNKIFQMLNRDNLSDKMSSHSSKSANRPKNPKEQLFLSKVKELTNTIQVNVGSVQKKKNAVDAFYEDQIEEVEKKFQDMMATLGQLKDQTLQALAMQSKEQKQTL